MKLKNVSSVMKVYWEDIRSQVAAVNRPLADVIDELNPGKQFPLYIARYQYGDLIVDRGRFFLPDCENDILRPLNSNYLSESTKDDLGYGNGRIPMGVVLHNSMELGIAKKNSPTLTTLYTNGAIFALWGYLEGEFSFFHPAKIFSLSAGSRCCVLLPKIGQEKGYKKLSKRMGCLVSPPQNLYDHHRVFVQIARNKNIECGWYAELLFFSKAWFDKLNTRDKKWLVLREFLLDYAWKKSSYFRNMYLYDSAFSRAQANRNLRVDPYLADTAKFLIGVASGFCLAFAPAVDNVAMPAKNIQQILLEGYGLQKYVPTIMHPALFDPLNPTRPVYYSLRFPTTYTYSPRSRKDNVVLHDVCDLRYILGKLVGELANGKVGMMDTMLEYVAQNVVFDFFHRHKDRYNEVSMTTTLPVEDESLLKSLCPTKNKVFAADSSFLQGCIRVSGKKEE